MDLSLPMTLAISVLAILGFGFASWRAKQPAEPLKVRMVNYHVVQMVCIIVFILMAAHMVTLATGRPFKPL